jgi:hypothetical protein
MGVEKKTPPEDVMKLRFWGAVLVFISAYSPLSVIFVIQDARWVHKTFFFENPILTISCLAVSAISCVLLIATVKTVKTGTEPVRIIEVSRRSGELVNYSIPYMISFFVVDLGDVRTLISFGFFLVLMFWMTYRTHNVFINPILVSRQASIVG